MTALLTLSAVAVSLSGLVYLAASDPKRRRAFKLPPRERRLALPTWILVLVPGAALLAANQSAAFVMWLGATTVVGWLVAARAPTPEASPKMPRDSY